MLLQGTEFKFLKINFRVGCCGTHLHSLHSGGQGRKTERQPELQSEVKVSLGYIHTCPKNTYTKGILGPKEGAKGEGKR